MMENNGLNFTYLGNNATNLEDFIQGRAVDKQTRYAVIIFYLLTFVFGFIGNVFVLYIIGFYTAERIKSVANYYIWSLALADLLFVLSLPLFCWATIVEHWPFAGEFGDVSCKIAYICRDVTKFAGAWTMVALSVDRCLASRHNTQRFRTIKAGKIVIASIWLVCVLLSLHYFFNAKTINGSCRLARYSYGVFWASLQVAVGYLLPSIAIFVAYSILWKRLSKRLNRRSSNSSSSSFTSSSRCMTRTILVVVVAFTVCQTPYHVVQIIYMATDLTLSDASMMVRVNATSQILVFVSSCCNPIIYGFLNQNFRRLYVAALGPCICHPKCARATCATCEPSSQECDKEIANQQLSRNMFQDHILPKLSNGGPNAHVNNISYTTWDGHKHHTELLKHEPKNNSVNSQSQLKLAERSCSSLPKPADTLNEACVQSVTEAAPESSDETRNIDSSDSNSNESQSSNVNPLLTYVVSSV